MGLIIDTGVIIVWERAGRTLDLAQWAAYGEAAISVITASELLVGVWLANTDARRNKRSAFVEAVLSALPTKDVTLEIARRHAEVFADIGARGIQIGAHDLLIAATALHLGYSVLTTNASEFTRVPGLNVLSLT